MSGVARIRALATQDLSAFNLDLEGMQVAAITVDGDEATWQRDGGELTIIPSRALLDGAEFATVVRYAGVPETINDLFGVSGFLHTDDGTVVAGEPHVAATWYPVNDHPTDQAAYTFHITVPRGLEAVANGVLVGKRTDGDWTTWTWRAASRWRRT